MDDPEDSEDLPDPEQPDPQPVQADQQIMGKGLLITVGIPKGKTFRISRLTNKVNINTDSQFR